jgi:phosphatidylglycerophosphatase C
MGHGRHAPPSTTNLPAAPVLSGPRAGVAAFDFDGTLVAGDSFLRFLILAVGRPALAKAVVTTSPTLMRHDRDLTKAAVLGQLLRGYPHDRVTNLGESYGIQLAKKIRPAMASRLDWHRAQGHRLVMVSASLDVYLRTVGRELGFDSVLATQLEVDEAGLLTGRLLGANCRRAEKASRLRRWLADANVQDPCELWAYGDSKGDTELLAMADHPTRV